MVCCDRASRDTNGQGAQIRVTRRDYPRRGTGTVTSTADIDARREVLRRRFAVWQPRTLSAWLDNCAARYRDRPMVFADERELTYEDITSESRRLADGLATIGVQQGDRVAMVMANYAEFVAIKFAIARAGAIAVPLNHLYR